MIRKFLQRLLERRHYWRVVGFSELAELYTSRLLRLVAANLFSSVAAIYMYQLGYPVWSILIFFSLYFLFRGIVSIPIAYFIARVGPKQGMLVSNFLHIPAVLALTQLEGAGIWALAIYGVTQGAAVSLYSVSYHTSFSKAKSSANVGKELSFMYIAEKLGTGMSPLIGGVIAYLFGPEMTMFVAMFLFVFSAGPLFLTPDPIMTRQKILFRGFNWRATRRNMVSAAAVGVDHISVSVIWSLFIAIAIFGTSSDIVYAQIGGLLTIAFLASIAFAHFYGVVIDRRQGGQLLRASVIGKFFLSLLRPFVSTPLGVVLINVGNEAVATGYSMPYLKGQYDMADNLPGYRIVYMTLMESAICYGAAVFGCVMTVLVLAFGGVQGLQVSYVVAAVASLPILMHGFPALRETRIFQKR